MKGNGSKGILAAAERGSSGEAMRMFVGSGFTASHTETSGVKFKYGKIWLTIGIIWYTISRVYGLIKTDMVQH